MAGETLASEGGGSRARLKREARLQWLDAEVRAGRYPNARAMAQALGVSERLAWADCAYLRDGLGLPVGFDRERGGWHYTEPDVRPLPLLHLSRDEAQALRRALVVAEAHLGPGEADPLRRLCLRLGAHVPEVVPGGRESAAALPGPHPMLSAAAQGLTTACDRAIRRRQRLRLLYWSAHRDETSDRVVRPYHLHEDRGEWYLLAGCESRGGDLRTFLLGRVREWSLLDPDGGAFRRPEGFDGAALIAQGFHLMYGAGERQRVVVRFGPYQARWIRERVYHPTQELEELEGGGLLVTMRVAGLTDVRRWVLSFGGEAEVLEPESLRREVTAELHRMCAVYGTAG